MINQSINMAINRAINGSIVYGVSEDVVTLISTGADLDPVITVTGSPDILWTWSDGATSTLANPGTKSFGSSATRTHTLWVSDWSLVTEVLFNTDALIGDIWDLRWDLFDSITGDFRVNSNNTLTGDLTEWMFNNSGVVYIYANLFSGSIPGLSSYTGSTFLCNSNSFTGYVTSALNATLLSFNASNNALTETAINQIGIDLDTAGGINGTVNVSGGTNAAPTGAGATAYSNLTGKGWTVTTN